MAEPFKNLVDARAVSALAAHISKVYPGFPASTFEAAALDGLEPLELKDRVRHVAAALRAALPEEWSAALKVLVEALPPWQAPEQGLSAGFAWWPVLQVVEKYGEEYGADAQVPLLRPTLAAIHDLTSRFSAEFAIRPYLVAHPEQTWATLAAWVDDPDPHVRRLVSEGSRSRLPWGKRLVDSVRDPSRGLALLDRLVDDPSPYVRRSVANHLGDVAKDHPDLAIAVARRWMQERPDRPERIATARHGLRTLLKAGHPDALALFGHGDAHVHVEALRVTPESVVVGEKVEVTARLRVDEPAHVRVDVVWSWPGSRGWASKTFRGGDKQLAPEDLWEFRYRLGTAPVTTRPTRPGTHRITLRVLGTDVGPVEFVLRA